MKGGEPHFTENNAEVAVADTAGVHLDENFPGFVLRNGTVFDDDRAFTFGATRLSSHLLVGEIKRKGSLAQRIGCSDEENDTLRDHLTLPVRSASLKYLCLHCRSSPIGSVCSRLSFMK